ncbi:hypothetical protein [Schleiferilactobacillus harbinensis]|uniref:Uncharacterized protein n=1 Tax=Schleiferilactobacillus harbinensis TaxID=304207 RepID=A0A5P8M6Y6_9LACO|nr:hypothetical protein [Schleiferilactobacillus harbinensis]QFR24077.1 hypothetical protein D1010_12170 [Schleiferilactobacillus harbinensis]
MADNDLTTTAKAVLAVNTHLTTVDARLTKVEKGGSTGGGDTGGGTTTPTDPTVPDSGVNVDPGTSLTSQKEAWSGSTKVNQADKLTLDASINKTLDNVGDGLQFVFKIVKTPLTSGTQGDVADLVPVASTSTTPQTGKYVCSVPVPISIKKGSFSAGKVLTIALDGIGEGLPNITKSAPPEIQLTLNSDGTISTQPIEGYAFDKLTGGSTGAYYDVVIVSVNTYTVVPPVVPLAAGTSLWSGALSSTIDNGTPSTLTLDNKLKADYSNVGNGVQLSVGSIWTDSLGDETYDSSVITFSTLQIAKADLVSGKTISLKTNMAGKTVGSTNRSSNTSNGDGTVTGEASITLKVGSQTLSVSFTALVVKSNNQLNWSYSFYPKLTKVTTY